MTPEQLHNNLLLLTTVGGAFMFETVAWRFAPWMTSFAAYVPVSTRRALLSASARASLSARDERATYRGVALGALTWSRLPGPQRFETLGAIADFDSARARVVVRLPFEPRWFGFGGIALVRLRAQDDAVVFTARVLPWLTFTSVAFFGTLLSLVAKGGPWGIGAMFATLLVVFNGLGAARTHRLAQPIVAAVVGEMTARIAASGEGSAVVAAR